MDDERLAARERQRAKKANAHLAGRSREKQGDIENRLGLLGRGAVNFQR